MKMRGKENEKQERKTSDISRADYGNDSFVIYRMRSAG